MAQLFKKAAVFTDLHLGLKGNSQVHNQDCEDFIDWYIDCAQKNNCDTGICCGDFHHNRSSLSITTLNFSVRILEKLGDAFDNFYLFVGNHDLYFKDRRDCHSAVFASHIKGITVVDDIVVSDRIALLPWLVKDEWKKIKNCKAEFMFGHFELPNFFMNSVVKMPDNGTLSEKTFERQQLVFSGHFHKRQNSGKIHYIGNAFPHNYADAWDDQRGMMIFDIDNPVPEFIDWVSCPKYRTLNLSTLLGDADAVVTEKMYLRVTVDIPISFEEAQFIREEFIKKYACRELVLIPQPPTDVAHSTIDVHPLDSIDQIITQEISAIESSNFNKNALLEIYRELK